MRAVAAGSRCLSCASNAALADLPLREQVYVGPRWRVAQAFGTSLPGCLVMVPRRHLIALDELTAEEAADLGPLLRALTAAMRAVLGCSTTYVALFAEAEGLSMSTSMSCPGARTSTGGCAAGGCSGTWAVIPPVMCLPR